MRACVRCGALRPAPTQLRGAVRSVQALQRAAPASRGSQGAGGRARLDQGCAARLSAAAAEGEPGPAAPQPGPVAPRGRGKACKTADGEAEPLPRKAFARTPGKRGEKTADGKPKPDERTVAYLVDLGWFKSEEEVVALLTRAKSGHHRFPFETAEPAADWLDATLGPEPVVRGLSPAARAVKTHLRLLTRDTATLQRNWDALMLPIEQGGVGCMLTQEEASEAFLKHPPILNYTVDNVRSGWSMLTATEGGLGLTHDEARKCILRNPQVLTSDFEKFTKRVELLLSLGYADAHRMVLAESRVLNFKDETVIEHAVWWQQTRLDHVKVITSQPTLLGAPTTTELHAKLDFLRRVVGMSDADLNNAASLLACSLPGRLRARFFYALQKQKLARFGAISTMMQVKDSVFLAMMQGRSSMTKELASDVEVKRYQKLVASPSFVAWRERREAQCKRGST